MGITFAIFKSSGKHPSSNDLSKIITKPLTICCFTYFSNDTLISIVIIPNVKILDFDWLFLAH